MLLAFGCGWLFSQIIKLIIEIVRRKGKIKPAELLYIFTKSGGMPSGHTASFMALSVIIYFLEGFNSPVFILAICTMAIIVYDALNVRYAVGEQGKVMNKIIANTKVHERDIKVVEGHTLPQAICGAILGVIIGVLVAFCGGIVNF